MSDVATKCMACGAEQPTAREGTGARPTHCARCQSVLTNATGSFEGPASPLGPPGLHQRLGLRTALRVRLLDVIEHQPVGYREDVGPAPYAGLEVELDAPGQLWGALLPCALLYAMCNIRHGPSLMELVPAWALVPLVLLVLYFSAATLSKKVRLRLTRDGLTRGGGPLPLPFQRASVPLDQLDRFEVTISERTSRAGKRMEHATLHAHHRDGRRSKLLASNEPLAVRDVAAVLSDALSQLR